MNKSCQTARIIQWLGGEQAVDVPTDVDRSSLSKEDFIDHKMALSKVECIELLRLPSLNKHVTSSSTTTTFERACLLRRSSSRLSRLSPDAQTSDEAYCTLSSHRSIKNNKTNNLIHQESTSDNSSLSITIPIPSLTIDDIHNTLDRVKSLIEMENNLVRSNIDLLREITQQNQSSLSTETLNQENSMELYRDMITDGDQDFKDMVSEFVRLIEQKLSDTEKTMFDSNTTRATSPSLFDTLNDLKTCLTLLRRTEVESLLNVFDNVLKLHCYPSALPESEETTLSNQENITIESHDDLSKLSEYAIDQLKIVKIEKTHQPLGLTISRSDSGTIHIARILVGGIAANSQLFQVNDRILEINDQSVTGHSLDSICTLISNTQGQIKFLLVPPKTPNHISYRTFHVRALFNYDPFSDHLIPCKEIGLKFHRGDILRIVARDESFLQMKDSDVSWWQAYYETQANTYFAGLIPSDSLQEKRTNLLKAISDDKKSISSLTSSSSSSSSSLFNGKKKIHQTCFTCVNTKHERKHLETVYSNVSFVRDSDDKETPTIKTSTNHFSLVDTRKFDDEQSSTTLKRFEKQNQNLVINEDFRFYEPVFQLDLLAKQTKRPVVLLGAPNVGRHELRRRLLETEPALFDVAIPHTTRARRLQETPDVDYHFVSEADFLAKVACHSFVEFGQYDRDLYGTSIDDIRQVVQNKRKICILNLNPEAIRTFNKTDIYPYIIFIAAPSLDRLKRLELDRHEHINEKNYREIIRKSRSIARRHRLLFDHTLVNNDLNQTYIELRDLILRIQNDNQQWVRTCYQRS